VTILEQSPALPPGALKGARTIVVAGRRARLRAPHAGSSVFVATWRTAAARYLMLANGSRPDVLEEFIGCLP
jgi:hypothetical protein